MVRTVLIRTTSGALVAAAFALLAGCEPSLPPVEAGPPIPPGPTPAELADYATAQMQYRQGLATGNGDAVTKANDTFYRIPREIFSRQDPRLFAAEVVCEGYPVAANGSPTPQCQNIERHYNEATQTIRRDAEARIAAADFATIAQAAPHTLDGP
jgi:hypothetical protein